MAAAMASSAGPSVPLAGPSTPTPPPNPPPPVPIHRTPARSILKQPPPPPKPFFSLSTFSKLLPSQNAPPPAAVGAGENIRKTPLKRAHFVLPHLSTTYPIWSGNPPATGDTQEEKRSVEEKERERRIRVVRGNSLSSANAASPGLNEEWGWWSAEKVEQFYRECCWGRDEAVNVQISTAIRQASIAPRSLDLTGVQLTCFAAAAFADILNVEWGLRKLVLKDCQLDDLGLKPILHSLLLPNSLSFLSIAANKNLKANAWRLIGVYLGKAAALQFLDVSQNPLDKRAVEHLVVSLGTLPPTVPSQQPGWATPTSGISSLLKDKDTQHGLVSLRMDDCQLKPQALEALAHAVRSSPLRNISLRANRIAPGGAVAIALMIKDYPDTVPVPNGPNTPLSPTSGYLNIPFSPPGSYSNSPSHSPLVGPTELPHPNSPGFLDKLQEAATAAANKPLPPSALAGASASATPAPPQKSAFALRLEQTARSSIAAPTAPLARTTASVNTSTASGTTYTPYIPRNKRSLAGAVGPQTPPVNGAGAKGGDGDFQLITSSVGGGVTMRHHPGQGSVTTPTQGNGGLPSAALLDKVRALDLLPRLGALRTLDLRGNDIRTGVTYISQVLKRNRTLKVLNLADNKIAVDGLVAIAEALKYNSSLETLDMSRNPCCGPGLEGVTSLRTAFTLNTSLKRLFLSSTGLLSPGAIMLAEFLPESTSLLHLDLTQNWGLDMAGVMALSVGLKANEIMRCLDLNIPAGDEEMARLCRDILGSCVRNTEKAEAKGGMKREGTGVGRGVWGMIEDSALARGVREGEVSSVRDKDDVIPNARIIQVQLENYLARSNSSSSPTGSPLSPSNSWSSLSSASSSSPATAPATPGAGASPELANLLKRANTILPSLVALIERSSQRTGANAQQLEELLTLNDALTNLVAKAKEIAKPVGLGIVIPNGAGSGGVGSGGGYFAEGSGSPGIPSVSEEPEELDELEDETPTTPRVDKGKGKARELELEVDVGVVDSDSRLIPEPASAGLPPGGPGNQHLGVPGEGEGEHQLGSPSATTAVSRSWVEEEGEIFRKGVVLLGPDEMEGEFAGDELRRELLEAQVERPPQRVLDGDEELMIDVDTVGPPPPSINPQTAAAIHNPIGGGAGSPRSPRSPASMAGSPRTPDGGRGLPPTTAFAARTRAGSANSLGLAAGGPGGGGSGSPTVAVSRVRAGSSSSVPSQHQQQ